MLGEKKTWQIGLKKYGMITIACFFYGAAISLFLDPNNIAPGGVSGLAVIIHRLLPVETGTLIFLINIPILCIGLYKFGIRFLVSTIYATAVSSGFTNLLAGVSPVTQDPLLASVIGCTMEAIALGTVFRCGATTGGTDIVVKILRLRLPHLKTGRLFLLCDMVVVSLSAFVFDHIDSALYGAIGVGVMSMVFDLVLYGGDGAKLIYIISEHWEPVAKRILEELSVGVTYLEGEGAYTKARKRVIMCVIHKQIAPQVEEIIREEDGEAFMIISSAAEIYGQGYKNIFSDKI